MRHSASPLELLQSLANLANFRRHRGQRLGKRIVNLLGIGNHHPFAVAEDYVAGNSDYGGILGHAPQHDRTRANPAVSAHGDVAENFRAIPDHDIIFNRRMALAAFLARSSQSYALI